MLLIFLLAYAGLEFFVLAQAASWLGWYTLGLLLLGFLAGLILVRRGGLDALSGRREAPRALFCALAGLLLMTPGFVSDSLGLLLLLPPVQDFIIRRAGDYFLQRTGLSRLVRFMERDAGEKTARPEGGRRKIDETSIIDVYPDKEQP